MIKVKEQDIVDFVAAQPDDRVVAMPENMSSSGCGCIMVHYFKEVAGLESFSCGLKSVVTLSGFDTLASLPRSILAITNLDCAFVGTYGEVKKRMGIK